MILVDANLLLYAYDETSEHHVGAKAWLEQALQNEPVRFAWVGILAFLRITTNPRIFKAPLLMGRSAAIVAEWLARPNVAILQPTERHWGILSDLLESAQVRAALVTDAHLAALAVEHGATLVSVDRDFSRFEGLKLENPLAPPPSS